MTHKEYKNYKTKSWEDLWLDTCTDAFDKYLTLEEDSYKGGVFQSPEIWMRIVKNLLYADFLPMQTRGYLISQFNREAAKLCKHKFGKREKWIYYLILHYEKTVVNNFKDRLEEAKKDNDEKGIEYTNMLINAAEDFADALKSPSSSAQICAKCNLPIMNSD